VAFFPIIDAIQEFKIESNSPPAEFRPLQTAASSTHHQADERFHGNASSSSATRRSTREFLSVHQREAGVPPQSVRRHLGGPLVRDHTFFFVTTRAAQSIAARTPPSRRSAASRDLHEAIAGRCRSSTIPRRRSDRAHGRFRQHDSAGRWIGALSLLQRYPLPTAPARPTNCRTDNEVDDQDQWDAHRSRVRANRDQVSGLSYFRDGFLPVTPLPMAAASRPDAGRRTRRRGVRVELPATFRQPAERVGSATPAGGRGRRRSSSTSAAARSAFRHPRTRFPETLPTF
jgi:hypothetical protein